MYACALVYIREIYYISVLKTMMPECFP